MKRSMKKVVVVAILATLGMFISAEALADDSKPVSKNPWSLSGNAIEVVGGLGDSVFAIELSSGPTTDSSVTFTPPKPITFADLKVLSAWFNVTATDCTVGSPRFQIALTNNGTTCKPVGNPAASPASCNVSVYFGPPPSFTGCPFGWQSTGNLITSTDPRFDTLQVLNGIQSDTYADALKLVGSLPVQSISLIVDSGDDLTKFPRGQVIQVDDITINNFRLIEVPRAASR